MALSIKALASGQLAVSKGTIYTVPGSTQTVVKSITMTNTDASTRTLNLYVNTAGTSRRITPKDLSLIAGAQFILDHVITLEAADLIEGDASVASVVDFVISGAENA